MTGTVRLTICNAKHEDKGKYVGKIFKCPKEITETSLKVEGNNKFFKHCLKIKTTVKTVF